jgi:hypothetical protein
MIINTDILDVLSVTMIIIARINTQICVAMHAFEIGAFFDSIFPTRRTSMRFMYIGDSVIQSMGVLYCGLRCRGYMNRRICLEYLLDEEETKGHVGPLGFGLLP